MSAVPTTPEGRKKLMVKTNVFSYTQVIKRLTIRDSTIKQLVEISGLHRATVGNMIRAFHKLDVIHVCGWLPDSEDRDTTPIYRWGQGLDVKRRKLSPAERQRRMRERYKARRDSTRQQDIEAIEKGLKSELAKTKPATSAGSGYSIFVQANQGLNGSCSEQTVES